jgi:multimeric flavodoxin WrbA
MRLNRFSERAFKNIKKEKDLMNKKIVVISTSMRANSNSEALAKSFTDGASNEGNDVEFISLKDKQVGFCKGCLVCQQTGNCVIKDDVKGIMDKVIDADIVVWATPIYYYEMSGQMKVLIDRLNPMFSKDYKFRDVYFLATAAEDEEHVYEKALSGLNGWIDCFDKAELKGYVFCGGVTMGGEISGNAKLKEAYDMGAGV